MAEEIVGNTASIGKKNKQLKGRGIKRGGEKNLAGLRAKRLNRGDSRKALA